MGIRRAIAVLGCVAACSEPASGRGAPPFQPTQHPDDDDGGSATLDVDPLGTTGPIPEEGGGDEGFGCDPEDVQACPCPDGPGMGIQSCEDGLWGPCVCDDGTTGADGSDAGPADGGEVSDGGEGSTGEPPPPPTEVCYPGAQGQYDTCLALHAFDPDAPPAGYAYPDALGGDPNYRRPVAFVDLQAEDPATVLAPNFTLGEFAQLSKGRWAIVQPHAVESVQALRDAVGPIAVNSGFRSPEYNAGIGGAGYSRHMYGDGFDLDPVNVSIDTLEVECEGNGGMLVEYETHVHCDWRFDDADEGFFGPPGQAAPASIGLRVDGEIHHDGRVYWTSTEGFDEGVPVCRWTAHDEAGMRIGVGRGPMFVAPRGAVRVEVVIGAAIRRASIDG